MQASKVGYHRTTSREQRANLLSWELAVGSREILDSPTSKNLFTVYRLLFTTFMKLLYLGTPAIAVAPLEKLYRAGYEIVGVVTQPDRPAGRKHQLTPPPVKVAAQALNLPIFQPETLKNPEVVEQLRQLQPNVGIVAAYGEILRRDVLAIPPLGYLNIHPSILPLYRGPAPTTGAILAGDDLVGVSIIKLTSRMDAGPILAQSTMPLAPDARAGELTDVLMKQGGELLLNVLQPYAAGQLMPYQQDDSQATYTSMISKHDGMIDWSQPAIYLERMTRAYDPWPSAMTMLDGQPFKIIKAKVWANEQHDLPHGTLLQRDQRVLVVTGSGALELLEVQPAGKKAMSASDWRRGNAQVERFGA